MDVENKYIEQDGIVEDTVEEMRIEIGEEDNSDDVSDSDELMDDDDRQIIDTALHGAKLMYPQQAQTQYALIQGEI